MDCQDRRDLLLAYAADVADGPEREALRAHLQSGCPICNAYLAEARELLAMLPVAVAPQEPPQGAYARLKARTGQSGGAMRVVSDHTPVRKWGWVVALTGIAALLFGGIAVVENRQMNSLRQQFVTQSDHFADQATRLHDMNIELLQSQQMTQHAARAINDLQHQILEQKAHLADQTTALASLNTSLETARQTIHMIEAPDVVVVNLDGSEKQPKARARVYMDPAGKTIRIFASGLDPLPAHKTYELWLINKDQKKIRVGEFDPSASGEASASFALPTAGDLAVAAITDEPTGGVPQPTGSIQLVGKL